MFTGQHSSMSEQGCLPVGGEPSASAAAAGGESTPVFSETPDDALPALVGELVGAGSDLNGDLTDRSRVDLGVERDDDAARAGPASVSVLPDARDAVAGASRASRALPRHSADGIGAGTDASFRALVEMGGDDRARQVEPGEGVVDVVALLLQDRDASRLRDVRAELRPELGGQLLGGHLHRNARQRLIRRDMCVRRIELSVRVPRRRARIARHRHDHCQGPDDPKSLPLHGASLSCLRTEWN